MAADKLFVFRSRQCLHVFARIAQGAEHQSIRGSNRNMEGARQDIIDTHDTHALPAMRFHHPLESVVLPVLDL